MQLETAINRLIKYLNTRLQALSVTVTSGSIDSMENYKYIIGQINGPEATKQELSNLLNDKEQMKEQSSILKPNNELVGLKKSKTEEPKLPKPTGWRLLVLPFKMKEKTKGGLHLAETTLEKQQVASQVGLVMAMVHNVIRIRRDILRVHGVKKKIGLCLHVMQVVESR